MANVRVGASSTNVNMPTQWVSPLHPAAVASLVFLGLLVAGCRVAEPVELRAISRMQHESTVYNGLSTNALTSNALTNNALITNALTSNSLSYNAMAFNAMAFNAMAFNAMAFNAMAFNGLSENAMAFNAMAFNAMAFNAMAFNAMAFNAMAFNELKDNPLLMNSLATDENFRALVRYAYACAMPPDAELELAYGPGSAERLQLHGRYGHAPDWAQQPCGEACRLAVATCVATFADPDVPRITLAEALKRSRELRHWLSDAYTCAMPEDAAMELILDFDEDGNQINGPGGTPVSYATLEGRFGLAPAWGGDDGHCDAACRAVVTDCVRRLSSPLIRALSMEEDARQIFKYIYSCAMPQGNGLTLELPGQPEPITFHGSLGVAPEWGTESCNESCQRWVSACVLARTNAYGIPVELSLRAPHPDSVGDDDPDKPRLAALVPTDDERVNFTLREGAYFGNLFSAEPSYNSCVGPGSNVPDLTMRFCSNPGDDCALVTRSYCRPPAGADKVCPSDLLPQEACDYAKDEGLFQLQSPDCASIDSQTGAVASCRAGGENYDEVITAYLRLPTAYCGDGICQPGESTTDCPIDCHDDTWATLIGSRRPLTIHQLLYGARLAASHAGFVVGGSYFDELLVGRRKLGSGTMAHPRWGMLAMFDPNDGQARWAIRENGATTQTSIAVAKDGSVLVAGMTPAYALTNRVSLDTTPPRFIRRYRRDGHLLWEKAIAETSFESETFIPRIIGPIAVGNGGPVVFQLRDDLDAPILVDDQAGPTFEDWQPSLVPRNRNVTPALAVMDLVSGRYTLIRDDYTESAIGLTAPVFQSDNSFFHTYSVRGGRDAGVALRSAAGELLGHFPVGGRVIFGLASDRAGGLYAGVVGGLGFNSAHVSYEIKHFGGTGQELWSLGIQGSFIDPDGLTDYAAVTGLAAGPDGSVLLSGRYRGRIVIGDRVLTQQTGAGFIARVNADSTVQWVREFANHGVNRKGPALALIGDRIGIHGGVNTSAIPAGHLIVERFAEAREAYGAYVSSFIDPSAAMDTTGPVISRVPDNLEVDALDERGAALNYQSPVAADAVQFGPIPVECSPAAGTLVPVGTHTVSCTATDERGNEAVPVQFSVEVIDRQPPEVEVRGPTVTLVDQGVAATVSYDVTATDAVDGSVTPSCSPPPGSGFSQGTTTVVCTAEDRSGNVGSASFLVRVPYVWSGFLPPLRSEGTSLFVQGRSIPVLFFVATHPGRSVRPKPSVSLLPTLDDASKVGPPTAESIAVADTCEFQSIAFLGLYVCQLETRGLDVGLWDLRIDLGDGERRATRFQLRSRTRSRRP